MTSTCTTRLRSLALLSLLTLAATACVPEELIENYELDRFCGDRPCGWEVDGKVARVGTWHSDDYAVELLGKSTRMHQLNEEADETLPCYEFRMLADIDEGAAVYLELDFLDDGVIELSERLRGTNYEPLRFLISTPDWYRGVRFALRKTKSGRAVIAKLRVTESHKCTRAPLTLQNRPAGASCAKDEECSFGACGSGICAGCADDMDCDEGEVCGRGRMAFGARECIAAGQRLLGDRCILDAECESGMCTAEVCSECDVGSPCEDGASCTRPREIELSAAGETKTLLETDYAPYLCGADEPTRSLAQACVASTQCESGSCSGVAQECLQSCERTWFGCLHDECDPVVKMGQCE